MSGHTWGKISGSLSGPPRRCFPGVVRVMTSLSSHKSQGCSFIKSLLGSYLPRQAYEKGAKGPTRKRKCKELSRNRGMGTKLCGESEMDACLKGSFVVSNADPWCRLLSRQQPVLDFLRFPSTVQPAGIPYRWPRLCRSPPSRSL